MQDIFAASIGDTDRTGEGQCHDQPKQPLENAVGGIEQAAWSA
jgi:hypothetical protein